MLNSNDLEFDVPISSQFDRLHLHRRPRDLIDMFFLHRLERTITLHPSFFGPRIKEYLTNKLLQDVEGTCTGSFYIICCLDSFEFSEGRVVPGSAVAEYTVSYRAVVWRPFRGETVRLRVDLL